MDDVIKELCRRSFSTRPGHYVLVHFFKRNMRIFVVKLEENHCGAAFATERIIAESKQDRAAPLSEAAIEVTFFTRYGMVQMLVDLTVSCVKTAIADHFKMFFRDMMDQTLNELHDRDGFFYIDIILMAIVVEGDQVTIIGINAGSGNDRSTKITPNVFGNDSGVAFIGFGIDIETIFVIFIAGSFHLFERRTDFGFHFIQKRSTEGITKICIMKMFHISPEPVITVSSFGDEAMDVRVPLEISAEGMKNHDEPGSKVF